MKYPNQLCQMITNQSKIFVRIYIVFPLIENINNNEINNS